MLEWPGFLKERDEDRPEANCLFHVFMDHCAPRLGEGNLSIGKADCGAVICSLPEQTGFTEYEEGRGTNPTLFGLNEPLPAVSLTPWRLQPSLMRSSDEVPNSRSIPLGAAWQFSPNDAMRGTSMHLALRAYLMRPDLATSLPLATGLDKAVLMQVADRAKALKDWLAQQGYTDLHCEIPISGYTPEGAEIHGAIDLLAMGKNGALLIDHKTGGSGKGLGPYWPQLSTYAALFQKTFSDQAMCGAGVFWLDHGRLELVEVESSKRDQGGINASVIDRLF